MFLPFNCEFGKFKFLLLKFQVWWWSETGDAVVTKFLESHRFAAHEEGTNIGSGKSGFLTFCVLQNKSVLLWAGIHFKKSALPSIAGSRLNEKILIGKENIFSYYSYEQYEHKGDERFGQFMNIHEDYWSECLYGMENWTCSIWIFS